MSYFLALELRGRLVVVVGGGSVANRRVPPLLDAGAQVTVISPEVTPALAALAEDGRITWRRSHYAAGTLAGLRPDLVFAATDSTTVNRQVAHEARAVGAVGAWVNVADGETASDFITPAVVEKPPVQVALHTGGASPSVLGRLKAAVAAALSEDLLTLTRWLGEIRPQVRAALPAQADRQALYEAVLASDVPELLRAGQEEAAAQRLHALLEERLPCVPR